MAAGAGAENAGRTRTPDQQHTPSPASSLARTRTASPVTARKLQYPLAAHDQRADKSHYQPARPACEHASVPEVASPLKSGIGRVSMKRSFSDFPQYVSKNPAWYWHHARSVPMNALPNFFALTGSSQLQSWPMRRTTYRRLRTPSRRCTRSSAARAASARRRSSQLQLKTRQSRPAPARGSETRSPGREKRLSIHPSCRARAACAWLTGSLAPCTARCRRVPFGPMVQTAPARAGSWTSPAFHRTRI